jgi:Ca-activated chloride channel family protein
MLRNKLIPYLLIAALMVGSAVIIKAIGTGQIKGTITDKKTGEGIIGASVMVVGSNFGAMTDFEGKYVIRRLQPGTYTVKISHLDYDILEVTEVEVKSDLSAEVSVQLEKKTTDLGKTITIKAERDVIDKFENSNQVAITKDQIMSQPVTSVDELLSQVAGVVTNANGEIFIRGGRAGDVLYMADMAPTAGPAAGCYRPLEMKRCGTPGAFPPVHGGTAIVNGKPFDAMFFENYGVNPFVDTEDDHLSTFAIDVDDASYVLARSYLNRGALPEKDAVRTEEFVNYFNYNYPAPDKEAFTVFIEGGPSRFGVNSRMIKIGIKGKEVRPENRKPANLVFVIDVSGSMARENRLGLVKKALRLLVDELRPKDRVGIVVYGSTGREVLQPTVVGDRERIISAIESLQSGGSTFAEQGIRFGYRMVERSFQPGWINRVILCSDGVANVGQTGAEEILKDIKKFAEKGITLTSVGFGMGNYNDVLLEKLGNKGNGHYAYVDNLAEARRVFVDNLTGTLQVIARDVKIQVDFNPEVVRSYRLIGYENRDVADNKFRDDKEDGGEIGAGHEVTALYEIKLHANATRNDVGVVYIRYKDPDHGEVTEINVRINRDVFRDRFENCSIDFKLAAAAAEFAEILRKSYWAKESSLGDVLALVKEISIESSSPEVIELLSLISKSQQFSAQLAER